MPCYASPSEQKASQEALAEMVKLYAERERINRKLNDLCAVAFPVGSIHRCTQWRYPVDVTVLKAGNGWGHDISVFVRSKTGKEYHVPATCLGIDYGEALRLARG